MVPAPTSGFEAIEPLTFADLVHPMSKAPNYYSLSIMVALSTCYFLVFAVHWLAIGCHLVYSFSSLSLALLQTTLAKVMMNPSFHTPLNSHNA